MPLYIVAMIQTPTPKQREEGQQEKLVMEPTAVIAANDKTAAIVAVQKQKLVVDLSNVEVLVRPF